MIRRRRFGRGVSVPSGLTLKGAKYVWHPRFLASSTHSATKNPKFRTEIEPECGEDLFFFFGLQLNFGAKFRSEIDQV